MKLHVFRPLVIFVAIVVLFLVARTFIVPKDFGTGERGYRFSWHRAGNEQEWKDFKVKYQGADYCSACHTENYDKIKASPHKNIQCENCHGPAIDHPENPPKLEIDKSRALCLRCHAPLPYASSGRSQIPSMIPEMDDPSKTCVDCHNPHSTAYVEAAK